MHTGKTVIKRDIPKIISPYNAQHIGQREEQQDYFAYSDVFNKEERKRIGAVSVLADGMGGMENGRMASRCATEVFLSVYTQAMNDGVDIKKSLLYAAESANDEVFKIKGAGTTLCAAVIKDGYLYWLSVGDSRIYLYRNGTLRQLNKEHNYENVLNEMVKNGEISVYEALNNPDRAALTSYIGMEHIEEIDVNKGLFPLFKGDSIMLCSDGLYRALSDKEMAEIVEDADIDVCERLVESALKKNVAFQDNITVVLTDVD